ncbi:hypothetical protein ATANTOWER_001338 [Ataeniobius toweri]|uniref:Uncharacterized protein n=1 Tax=Ataeniobius toweri TaxID=208326 RepID=A0ABU7ANS6_9TELE|nr:hypothetical protein [Ataeniobius toweri]
MVNEEIVVLLELCQSLECGLSTANQLPPPGGARVCDSRVRQVCLVLVIIWRSINGRIASTSLPECFALQRTQTKPRSWLVTDHFRTSRDFGSSPSWRSASLGAPVPLMRILSTLQRFLFIQTTEAPGGPLSSLPRFPDSSAISLADLAYPQTSSGSCQRVHLVSSCFV